MQRKRIRCVAELRSGEWIGAELVLRPDGSVLLRVGEAAIVPHAVKVVRVPHDCPAEILDAAILSGYFALGAVRALR